MSYFINFHRITGLSLSQTRDAEYLQADVTGLVDNMMDGHDGCCPLEGAKDALEDGSLWKDEHQESLEAIHALLSTSRAQAIADYMKANDEG